MIQEMVEIDGKYFYSHSFILNSFTSFVACIYYYATF